MIWTTAAHAMGGTGTGGEAAGLASFIPLILMFAVFYFLLIRPQQKRAKEHRTMLAALKRGDAVITGGGLYGTILETAEDYVVVDLGETKVKVSRSAVSAVLGAGGPKQMERKGRRTDQKDSGTNVSTDKD